MPTYEYYDSTTGKTVELQRRIAERDNVPPHLKRIVAPNIGGQGFMGRDCCREPGVDEAVPKAFREMELQGHSHHDICRQAGFSVDHIKRTWNFLAFLVAMLALSAGAADLTQGYIFTDQEHVTASKMNAIAGSATINAGFITAKSAATPAADGSDQFVVSQGGTLKRMTMTVLLANTNLINNPSEATTVLTNDYVLVLENGTLVKAQIGTLLSKIAGFVTSSTTPNTNNYIFTANNGATAQYASVPGIGGYSFTAGPSNLAAKGTFTVNIAHGFAGKPQDVRAVLVCTTAENGYSIGDEVDVANVSLQGGDGNSAFILVANATTLYLHGLGAYAMANRGTFVYGNANTNNWQAKVYARYWTY